MSQLNARYLIRLAVLAVTGTLLGRATFDTTVNQTHVLLFAIAVLLIGILMLMPVSGENDKEDKS